MTFADHSGAQMRGVQRTATLVQVGRAPAICSAEIDFYVLRPSLGTPRAAGASVPLEPQHGRLLTCRRASACKTGCESTNAAADAAQPTGTAAG